MIMSILLLIMGFFAAIYGAVESSSNNEEWNTPTGETIRSPKSWFGLLAFFCGFFVVCTGLLGCLVARCKVCYVTCPYVVCTGTMFFFMFITAIVALSVGDKEQMFDEICIEVDVEKYGTHENMYRWAEVTYGYNVNKVMCSKSCPCDPGLN